MQTYKRRVIACECVICPKVTLDSFINCVCPVIDRQLCQIPCNITPMARNVFTQMCHPIFRDRKAESPVRKFEGGVLRHIGTGIFTHDVHGRPKIIDLRRRVIPCELPHPVGGLPNNISPLFQRLAGRERLVFVLRKNQRMGLLPDEQVIDLPWCRPSRRVRHLRPPGPRAPTLLDLSPLERARQEARIDAARAAEEVPVVPECPMRTVPKIHFFVYRQSLITDISSTGTYLPMWNFLRNQTE